MADFGIGEALAIASIAATATSTVASFVQAQQQNDFARDQARAATAQAAAEEQAARANAAAQARAQQQAVEVARLNADAEARTQEAQNLAAAQAAELNQQIATTQAQQARDSAAIQVDETRERNRRLLARQRATLGGQGITTEGAPLLVLIDAAEQAALEEARLSFAGDVQAAGFENQAQFAGFQADTLRGLRVPRLQIPNASGAPQIPSRAPARAFVTNPFVAAGSTLLTGATNTLAGLQRTGAFSARSPSSVPTRGSGFGSLSDRLRSG